MSSELAGDRAESLLNEIQVTEAQQRAAGIQMAGRCLIAADGDWQAAKGMLRDALEAIGSLRYEPLRPSKTSRMQAVVNYERH